MFGAIYPGQVAPGQLPAPQGAAGDAIIDVSVPIVARASFPAPATRRDEPLSLSPIVSVITSVGAVRPGPPDMATGATTSTGTANNRTTVPVIAGDSLGAYYWTHMNQSATFYAVQGGTGLVTTNLGLTAQQWTLQLLQGRIPAVMYFTIGVNDAYYGGPIDSDGEGYKGIAQEFEDYWTSRGTKIIWVTEGVDPAQFLVQFNNLEPFHDWIRTRPGHMDITPMAWTNGFLSADVHPSVATSQLVAKLIDNRVIPGRTTSTGTNAAANTSIVLTTPTYRATPTFKGTGASLLSGSAPASIAPVCPAVVDAGDLLITAVHVRPATATLGTTPTGWTLLQNHSGGGGSPGGGTGPGRVAVYYKVAVGTEDSTAISYPLTGADRAGARCMSYTTTGQSIGLTATITADTTVSGAAPNFAATTDFSPAVTLNVLDLVWVAATWPVPSGGSNSAITAAGITPGTGVERHDAGNNTSNDIWCHVWEQPVTAGTGTWTRFNSTVGSTAATGPIIGVRMRDTGARILIGVQTGTGTLADIVASATVHAPDIVATNPAANPIIEQGVIASTLTLPAPTIEATSGSTDGIISIADPAAVAVTVGTHAITSIPASATVDNPVQVTVTRLAPVFPVTIGSPAAVTVTSLAPVFPVTIGSPAAVAVTVESGGGTYGTSTYGTGTYGTTAFGATATAGANYFLSDQAVNVFEGTFDAVGGGDAAAVVAQPMIVAVNVQTAVGSIPASVTVADAAPVAVTRPAPTAVADANNTQNVPISTPDGHYIFITVPAPATTSSATATIAQPAFVTVTEPAPAATFGNNASATVADPMGVAVTEPAPDATFGGNASATVADPAAVTVTGLAPTATASATASPAVQSVTVTSNGPVFPVTITSPAQVTVTRLAPDFPTTIGSPAAVVVTRPAPTATASATASPAVQLVTVTQLAPVAAFGVSVTATIGSPALVVVTPSAPSANDGAFPTLYESDGGRRQPTSSSGNRQPTTLTGRRTDNTVEGRRPSHQV